MRAKVRPFVAEESLEPEIGHHRRDQSPALQRTAALPGCGDERHELVAVDDLAALVGDDDTVGIAVERDADIGAHFAHPLAHRFGRRRAAFLVDVETVRLIADLNDLGAEFPQCGGRNLVGGAIGGIDDDPQAFEAQFLRETSA